MKTRDDTLPSIPPVFNRWLVLTAAILAFLPVVIDMTILHVAVPTLATALAASGNEVLWILDIYPLIMAGLLVPMGTLGDRIGHRRLMLVGLSIFTVASVIAAFSVSAAMLIGSRALLAVGGAMIMPAVLAVIRQAFDDPRERAMALGIWTVVGSAGSAIGPLAGGLLLEHFWWGSVFLVNVPVMLIVLPMAFKALPRVKPAAPAGRWKFGQALLLTAGLILTVYALKTVLKGEVLALAPAITGAVGLALLIQFGRLQRGGEALLDLTLLRHPVIASGLVMAFVASAALAGFELVLAQELQYSLGRTPLEAGLYLLPLVIACAVSGPIAGRLVGLTGLRTLAVGGLALTAVALAGIAISDLEGDDAIVPVLLALLGFAIGGCLLASSVAIMGATPSQKAGAAGALESTGYELGGALGIAFFGSMINAIYRSAWTPPVIPSDIPASAGLSMADAMTAAQALNYEDAERLKEAAATAFSSAHSTVLGASAALIGLLAVLLFFTLRGQATSIDSHFQA